MRSFCLTVLILLPLTAFAQDVSIKDMPPIWSACEVPQDCTLIVRNCGFSVAVNRSYKTDAEKFVDNNHLAPMSCSAAPTPPTGATCQKARCVGTRAY